MPNIMNIEKVIQRIRESFSGAQDVYTDGSCVKFAMILKEIYPDGTIMYDSNHAIFELGGKYYDIDGVTKKGNHIPIEEYGLLHSYDIMNLKN